MKSPRAEVIEAGREGEGVYREFIIPVNVRLFALSEVAVKAEVERMLDLTGFATRATVLKPIEISGIPSVNLDRHFIKEFVNEYVGSKPIDPADRQIFDSALVTLAQFRLTYFGHESQYDVSILQGLLEAAASINREPGGSDIAPDEKADEPDKPGDPPEQDGDSRSVGQDTGPESVQGDATGSRSDYDRRTGPKDIGGDGEGET